MSSSSSFLHAIQRVQKHAREPCFYCLGNVENLVENVALDGLLCFDGRAGPSWSQSIACMWRRFASPLCPSSKHTIEGQYESKASESSTMFSTACGPAATQNDLFPRRRRGSTTYLNHVFLVLLRQQTICGLLKWCRSRDEAISEVRPKVRSGLAAA